ncbi:hypothetical protein Taro_055797 [Colocasia esculenta]|uniref:Uncharacterized protein n=1 Tax=Colocasia esculenta TaxID=4460 RepID=A0A843XSB2_COLES|nr:hypothetical protein [Colocasia esculenta]
MRLNIVNVTVELSPFGRPKKEKLEPHLRPLLNPVNRGVNQVNQQSIVANERPVTFASTRRTSTVDNGDTAGRRNESGYHRNGDEMALTEIPKCRLLPNLDDVINGYHT